MTIASYSELVAELGEWLNRADLSARVPTFIRLFEARMNRRLRAPDMEATSTQDTEAEVAAYALPDDCRQLRTVYLATDPKVVLEGMTQAAMRDTYGDSATGQPQAYCVVGEQIILAPIPDGAYTLTVSYFATLTGLSGDNTNNWLLDDHPDAYLFGSLCMAEAYLKDDDRLAVWKSAWDEALAEIVSEANAKRLPAGPLRLRPTVFE